MHSGVLLPHSGRRQLGGGYDFWVTPQCSVGVTALVATMTATPLNEASVGDGLLPFWAGLLASVLYH